MSGNSVDAATDYHAKSFHWYAGADVLQLGLTGSYFDAFKLSLQATPARQTVEARRFALAHAY